MNLLIFSFCEEPGFLYVLLVVKYLIFILKILVPIILMYKAFLSAFKCIFSNKNLTKELFSAFKTVIASLIIFFIPSIINFAVDYFVDTNSDSNFFSCVSNSNLDKINALKKQQEDELKKSLEDRKNNIDSFNKEQSDKHNQQLQESEAENDSSNDFNDNSLETNTSFGNNADGSLFVGDSRTAAYNSQISLASTDTIYATSGGAINEFYSDVNKAINKINNNPSKRYNLILNYGVNNLSADWVSAYKAIINNLDGKVNILVVSVNPCNDNIALYCKNSNVVALNNKLKSAFNSGYKNVKYCDTYSMFVNASNYTSMIETQEGIHYTTKGANLIYKKIQQCLSNF